MVRKSNIVNEVLDIALDTLAPTTNKEAHLIFGNMNKESGGSSQTAYTDKKWVTRISDYFSKSGKPTISGADRPETTTDYPLVTN